MRSVFLKFSKMRVQSQAQLSGRKYRWLGKSGWYSWHEYNNVRISRQLSCRCPTKRKIVLAVYLQKKHQSTLVLEQFHNDLLRLDRRQVSSKTEFECCMFIVVETKMVTVIAGTGAQAQGTATFKAATPISPTGDEPYRTDAYCAAATRVRARHHQPGRACAQRCYTTTATGPQSE